MNEIDIINAYWTLIYNPNKASFQSILKEYQNICDFHEWLEKRNIQLNFVDDLLDRDKYALCHDADSVETVDIMLRTGSKKQFVDFAHQEIKKYQVLLIPGHDVSLVNRAFIDFDYGRKFQSETISVYQFDELPDPDNLSLYGPFISFMDALYQIDKWPGILVFNQEQSIFIKIDSLEEVDRVFKNINNQTIFESVQEYPDDSYFIQLSDFHLGPKKRNEGLKVLYDSLDEVTSKLKTNNQINFLVTGDLMDSPNCKNMYLADQAIKYLKRTYASNITFILGNHDVLVIGLNVFRFQKSKVIQYLLTDNINILEKEKIIILKIDSTSTGNLARGKIDERQLLDIEQELSGIKNIKDYQFVMMLHHHPYKINKDDFLKIKWNERIFIGRILEQSKSLVNATVLLDWIKKHNIKYVFHGHKHIANFAKKNGTYIIAGGSSCGGGAKEKRSHYISYNVLKYNMKEKKFKYCFIYYDDMTKMSRHRMVINTMED